MDKDKKSFFQKMKQTHIVFFHVLCMSTAVFLVMALFWTLKKNYQFFYSVNDDMFVRGMLSGEIYQGTGYSIMIKKWLGSLLVFLYRWKPYTEWYALCMWGGILASLCAIVYTLLSMVRSWVQAGAALVLYLILCLCFAEHFLVTTYTEVAALLMLAAICIVYNAFASYEQNENKWILFVTLGVSVFFCVASFSLRSDSCLMLFPFAGVLFLYYFVRARRECRWYCVGYAMVLLAILGAIYLHDRLAYTSVEAYQQVLPYCSITNPLYNYCGVPEYADHMSFYQTIGMSERTYHYFNARSYVFAQNFDIDQIAALSEYAQTISTSVSAGQWLQRMGESFLFGNYFPLGAVTGIVVLLNLVLSILKKNAHVLWLQILALAAYFADALYLTYGGRLPDRVIIPLYLALLILSLYGLIQMLSDVGPGVFVSVFFVVILVIFRGTVVENIHDAQGLQYTMFHRQEALYHYMNDNSENFYIVAPSISPTGGAFTYDKTKRNTNHIFFADYTTYLPEWKWKLEEYGIDPTRLLDEIITKEHVLLVAPSERLIQLIQEYLEEYYPQKKLVIVERIGDYYPAYNVY